MNLRYRASGTISMIRSSVLTLHNIIMNYDSPSPISALICVVIWYWKASLRLFTGKEAPYLRGYIFMLRSVILVFKY